ncbi:hypothetical protein Lalb_Chr10g0094211 [Lupinus albus]|uniref:Uncharacterized protein n=1 Tax=Lupinus albus TaxID=3870 RepID=A0A6A4PUJ5_LUPAL|nr:hypothetical protein Lalb_Chr10g0094211 [Lupinus albus]
MVLITLLSLSLNLLTPLRPSPLHLLSFNLTFTFTQSLFVSPFSNNFTHFTLVFLFSLFSLCFPYSNISK